MKPQVLVGFAFLLNALTVGPMKSLGIYFLQFQNNLGASAGEASLVSSILFGSFFLSGPIATVLANKIGYRRTILLGATLSSIGIISCALSQTMLAVYMTMGFMTGSGCGLTQIPSLAIMGIKFKEKRSFVNNIVTMGSSVAAIPLSLLVQLWIDSYGWRGSFLILGAVILHAIPTSLAMISPEMSKQLVPNKKKFIDITLLKTITFPLYTVACGLQVASLVSVTVYLVRFAQEQERNDYKAAALSSVISLVDVFLRPLSGYITSLSHIGPVPIRRSYYFSCVLCIQAVVVSMYPFSRNIYTTIGITVAYAVCIGSYGALPITILSDLFGTEKLVSSLGLRTLVVGISSLVTPPLIGKIIESTGSYNSPFYVSSALAVLAATLVFIVQIIILRKEKRANSEVTHINSSPEAVKHEMSHFKN